MRRVLQFRLFVVDVLQRLQVRPFEDREKVPSIGEDRGERDRGTHARTGDATQPAVHESSTEILREPVPVREGSLGLSSRIQARKTVFW